MIAQRNKFIIASGMLSLAVGIVLGHASKFVYSRDTAKHQTGGGSGFVKWPLTTGAAHTRLAKLDELLKEAKVAPSLILHERARLLLLEAKSPTLALKDLNQIITKHPASDSAAEAQFLKCEAYRRFGKLQDCKREALLFLKLYPNSWRKVTAAKYAALIMLKEKSFKDAQMLLGAVINNDVEVKTTNICPARLDLLVMLQSAVYAQSGKSGSAEKMAAILNDSRRSAVMFNESPALEMLNLEAPKEPLSRAVFFLKRYNYKDAKRAFAALPPNEQGGASMAELAKQVWLYPEFVGRILERLNFEQLSAYEKELHCILTAKAYVAKGDITTAVKYLTKYTSPTLSLELMELARTQNLDIEIPQETELTKLLAERDEGRNE